MCRVITCQTFVHRITSQSLQKGTGVFALEHYLANRTLLWAGHVARMPKSRLPKRLMLSWVQELERHLKHFGILDADGAPLAFTDWAPLAQDRAGWRKLVTKPPFAIGKPHVRQPRCDTRVALENK